MQGSADDGTGNSEVVRKILAQAAANSKQHQQQFDEHDAGEEDGEEGKKLFTGTVYSLTGTPSTKPSASNKAEKEKVASVKPKVRKVTFWRNGFTIECMEDENQPQPPPLLSYDDHKAFLEGLKNGYPIFKNFAQS